MPLFFLFLMILPLWSCQAQDLKAYPLILEDIAQTQDSLQQAYLTADSTRQDSILLFTRDFLIQTMTQQIFPTWYGTPWDFNGTTRTPQKGQIACGYFVTNTLTDLGFDIPRVKWAQSASEVFIKQLAFGNIQRFYNKPMATIKAALQTSGNGLYLVGLDNHTGFVWVEDDKILFIHADYYNPERGVVAQPLLDQSPLTDSLYRVFGKLFSDKMLVHWLEDTLIP